MTLPQDIDFSEIESLAILKICFEKDYTKQQEKFLQLFKIDKNFSANDAVDQEKNLGKSIIYENSAEKKYFAIEDNGFISYISGMTYDYINDNVRSNETLEKYDVDTDDISGRTVDFESGRIDISKLKESAEAWLEENMSVDGCEYRISDVYIREFAYPKGDRRQLSFYSELFWQGVRLNSFASEMEEDGPQVILADYGINMNYDDVGQISFFSNGVGRIRMEQKEEITEIIDLGSAIRLVNQEMSGFCTLNISKILPVYALYPKYKTEEIFSVPGQEIEGRPAYAFIIPEGEDDSDFGICKSNGCKVIFVDMVTGEITTNIR